MTSAFLPRIEALGPGRLLVHIDGGGRSLSYRRVLDLWQADAAFRSAFVALLAGVEFAAFRWETPPATTEGAGRPFECVILDTPGLDVQPDPATFSAHFGTGRDGVSVFPNLGLDSLLVVPDPLGPSAAYPHLAAFSRRAPSAQNHALWRAVGRAMADRIGDRPTWLSTAGGGVAWLHVRLDSRPKYYAYRPYADEPAQD